MRIAWLFVFWLLVGEAWGQKYDNVWIYGRYPANQNQGCFGNGTLEFMQDSVRLTSHWWNQVFSITSMSLSDRDGNFLASSNGMNVKDSTGQIIENGDSVNYGLGWEAFESQQANGSGAYALFQGIHFLPLPENDSVYYLFQILTNQTPVHNTFLDASICYSKMIVGANYHLYLENKNIPVASLQPSGPGTIASCKHANGRDWWVVYSANTSNCLQEYILSPTGLTYFGEQCLGDSLFDKVGLKSIFSQDGSLFARAANHHIDVFHFDRCNGELQLFKKLDYIMTYDSALGIAYNKMTSFEFSPNNRFLYAVHTVKVLQYDLNDADPNISFDTVALLDYFVDTVPNAAGNIFYFFQCQTGPDGKIYIGPYQGVRFLCTIHNPNGKGDTCDFRMRDRVLPKFWKESMPYYPNYRLGRLIGSPCDTVYHDTTITNYNSIYKTMPTLKLYPNPATTEVQLDYNWLEWERIENLEFRITNELGQVEMSGLIPKYSSTQKINIKQLAPGVYTIALTNSGKQVAVCRMTKM